MKKFFLLVIIGMLLLVACSQSNKEPASNEEIGKTQIVEKDRIRDPSKPENTNRTMYPALATYIESVVADIEAIPEERKNQLKKIALFVHTKKQSNELANLTFICTHNSRRSQMSQIWAATAAAHYGIEEGVNTYSGGTEATAFNPRAVEALKRAGFKVENTSGDNPHYNVTYGDNGYVMECFSKRYDDPSNANENFVAIMTCSEADKNCPYIPGASLRVPIPYLDPKESDGTEHETATYDNRCKQIATDMFFLMSQVKTF